MRPLLSRRQLQRLSEHKYSVEGQTLLEPLLQVYWTWLLKFVPLWWSPNAITLVGLLVNLVFTCILLVYSPDAKQNIPGWAYILSGIATFVYQSLDSIDGKQARRTHTSSPLGELLDHGCDAVTNGMISMGMCVSFKLGNEPHLMTCLICFQLFLFYCAHWQSYVSGTLEMYTFDVNESHYYAIGIYFITSSLGEDIWSNELGTTGIQIKDCIIYVYLIVAFIRLTHNFNVIFIKGGIGKDGSTTAGTSTVFPFFPIAIVIALQITLQTMSPYQVYQKHACLYLSCFSILVAKVTARLMVANLSKSEMSLLCSGLVGPGLMFANQYFNCFINEYLILWVCFLIVIVDFIWYVAEISSEICQHLNIYCFSITSRPRCIVRNGTDSN